MQYVKWIKLARGRIVLYVAVGTTINIPATTRPPTVEAAHLLVPAD